MSIDRFSYDDRVVSSSTRFKHEKVNLPFEIITSSVSTNQANQLSRNDAMLSLLAVIRIIREILILVHRFTKSGIVRKRSTHNGTEEASGVDLVI